MTLYQIYGRRLASGVELPELAVGEGPSDLGFEIGRVREICGPWFDVWPLPDARPWIRAARTAHGYRIRYEQRADFLIDRVRRTITCEPIDCPAAMMRHFLLDQVVPLMLSLESIVLHASSVAAQGGFVAFLGPGGAGKSTIALALGRAGHAIGSDDGLLLGANAAAPAATPSYSIVRVWDDSASAIAAGPPANAGAPSTQKRRYHDGILFAAARLPLARLYVIEPEPASSIRFAPISARAAAIALVEQSYRLALDDRDALARELDDLAGLARRVPAWRLAFPRRLDAWRELSEAVMDHVGHGAACEAI